ncbi:30S ribosomal protein S6 [Adhaeretor mobilis]|uniref:Small ribosomal subunit protein bS6 n=1 Tax=Adhaeretor mobilis TaxID=1930276 RepID=A0A517MT08_9BACT|nr:30S ribosomal protein S6 [Adhaeretor mobilis]QDS97982.1 30S ribosomal protein S6 [Adhaeretor mobilis]
MADNTATYEGLFIFDANRFARDREALAKQVEGAITDAGGNIQVSRLWEERRLAYPINGQRKGAYWLMYFELSTQKVTELTRVCELNDSLLRQLFVRLPESLVEPILDHVRGGGTPEDVPSEVEPEVVVAAATE